MSPHDAQTIQTLTDIAVWIIRLAAVVFTLSWIVYSTAPRWYRSSTGWALWSLMLWATLLLDLALLFRTWDGHVLVKAYASFGVYTVIAASGCWLLVDVVRNRLRRH